MIAVLARSGGFCGGSWATAGGIRPEPVSWTLHFRCGYPPPAREPVVPAPIPVPQPIRVPPPAVPDPFPGASQAEKQPRSNAGQPVRFVASV